ncbi:hypothetical protein LAC81_07760 [Ensifer adhaerens]|uniref:hypothetical protein n=1 Tax=Ensifer adhaerens TaxID=106592 RepID=UPI001CBEFD28|nr:hypothetical protein [Ensifer adhaerens]MBZ7921676.1 hypothetical protein [Ensifer adhaerens]UAX94797.1 hypothetical protein LAC78_07755 [Ensifer adhaerens]UAY02429.1 hypothetical protein LAC80_07760 [Ensifer adhaerens]UAY09808.1 hypothetical protein LAC81_07760 [Ensifer adhaerens]
MNDEKGTEPKTDSVLVEHWCEHPGRLQEMGRLWLCDRQGRPELVLLRTQAQHLAARPVVKYPRRAARHS